VSDKCGHTLNEFETYRYPNEEERLRASVQADMPIKLNDDCMDALRYGLYKHLTTFNQQRSFNTIKC
ncbi:MAG: hypothetical protein IKE05_02690, partial [Clostridia bacterium]|nr:hypothetical protein [Clostridia bacterium]